LEEKITCRELDYFLGVRDDTLEEDYLADEAAGDVFALFWEAITLPAVEVLSCFQK